MFTCAIAEPNPTDTMHPASLDYFDHSNDIS